MGIATGARERYEASFGNSFGKTASTGTGRRRFGLPRRAGGSAAGKKVFILILCVAVIGGVAYGISFLVGGGLFGGPGGNQIHRPNAGVYTLSSVRINWMHWNPSEESWGTNEWYSYNMNDKAGMLNRFEGFIENDLPVEERSGALDSFDYYFNNVDGGFALVQSMVITISNNNNRNVSFHDSRGTIGFSESRLGSANFSHTNEPDIRWSLDLSGSSTFGGEYNASNYTMPHFYSYQQNNTDLRYEDTVMYLGDFALGIEFIFHRSGTGTGQELALSDTHPQV